MFLLYYILSFVFYWGFYCKKIIKFCYYDFVLFLLVIIKNQYYDIFILFHHQVNVFYTKNLKDVSMKWGVINLNTPFNNWSCINTSVHTFRVKFMVLNATFNNISVILWWSVLLVEESGVPGESHQPAASHWQTSSTNVVSNTPRLSGIQIHNVSDDRHWLHIIRVILFNATFNNTSVIYGGQFY
jgi:hypothetical protein